VSQARSSRITSIEPGPVRARETVLRLWGDDEAGWVNDWVYVSSERLYQIVLSMPPGGAFRHSERNRTIFGADELYLVLRGSFALTNPQTGEVVRLNAGDAAWFGPDTWHHGFVLGDEEAAVLEFFAPPPAAGMSQDYARTKPYLDESRYRDDRWTGTWPRASGERSRSRTIHPVRADQILWRLEDGAAQLSVGLMLSTPRLTVGTGELLPGRRTDERTHGGDLGLYVVGGTLTVTLPSPEGPERVFHLAPADGFFVPQGTAYRLANLAGERARFIFGVAPLYDAG
jgi:quercetin dioxygenase-like cupin family protein